MRFAVAREIVLDSFEVPGVPLAEDVGLLDLVMTGAITDNISFSAGYNGQFAEKVTENAWTAMLRMRF